MSAETCDDCQRDVEESGFFVLCDACHEKRNSALTRVAELEARLADCRAEHPDEDDMSPFLRAILKVEREETARRIVRELKRRKA